MGYVKAHIPADIVGANHVNVGVTFPAPCVKRTHVHVVEHEAGSVTHAEAGNDLVGAVGAEPGEVGIDAVVPEACLNTSLIGGGHLGLEAAVGTGVAILVTAAGQTGGLELGIDREHGSILTYLGDSATQFQVVNEADILHELHLAEHD